MSEQIISRIPGRKELYPITRTEGSEPMLRPSTADRNQIDSSVRGDNSPEGQARDRAAQLAGRSHMPSQIVTDPIADASLEVCLGDSLVLRPSPIHNTGEGFRTKGGTSSHECYSDGDLLSTSEALAAIYSFLVEQNSAPKAKGKK